jgi:hypothetical protein
MLAPDDSLRLELSRTPCPRARLPLYSFSSKTKLCHDRLSVGQSVLVSSPTQGPTQIFVTGRQLWGCWFVAPSHQRGRVLAFTIAAGASQRSHSRVRVPTILWPYVTVFDLGLSQSEGPGPRIYIPQKQSGPAISPGNTFHFRRLLRLTELWWKYSNPPLHGRDSAQSQSHITTDVNSISKSWCLAPSGAHDQIFITLWQLLSCFCGAPSLTRGRVCLFYMLLALTNVIFLGSESLGTRDYILLSQIWDFPFRRLLRLAGSRCCVSILQI